MNELKPMVITNMNVYSTNSGRMELSGNRNYIVEISQTHTRITDADTYKILLDVDGSMTDPAGYLQQKEFIHYMAEMLKLGNYLTE